jgi:antitoxin PrlF
LIVTPSISLLYSKEKEIPMTAATLTSKGQITIPSVVRRAMNVETGDRIEFVEVQPGRFEIMVATQPVQALKGMFGKPTRRVSIDDMNQAIAAQGAAAAATPKRSAAKRGKR